jgi:hypothetical protein
MENKIIVQNNVMELIPYAFFYSFHISVFNPFWVVCVCVCVCLCVCVCVCVCFERFKGLISFFCMWMSSFPNISLRKHHLPSVYYWHVCQKPLGYKCRCISELFWCINLCVFILFWLLRLCSIF